MQRRVRLVYLDLQRGPESLRVCTVQADSSCATLLLAPAHLHHSPGSAVVQLFSVLEDSGSDILWSPSCLSSAVSISIDLEHNTINVSLMCHPSSQWNCLFSLLKTQMSLSCDPLAVMWLPHA